MDPNRLTAKGKVMPAPYNIGGKPLLFDARDKDRHRRPLYVGVPEVTIPKRFHIHEIVAKHLKDIGLLFIKYFKG